MEDNMERNTFTTPTYAVGDGFQDMSAVRRHLEYKINAVVTFHREYGWVIDDEKDVKRYISERSSSAYAIIKMCRIRRRC